MNTFESNIKQVGTLSFPRFTGTRVMMMPIRFDTINSCIPAFLEHWREAINTLVELSTHNEGVGYITIDETNVEPGNTQRRPGLHVDGIGPNGKAGAWGGGGGAWGSAGMLTASSVIGCKGWDQTFRGFPSDGGDCEHLRPQCKKEREIVFQPEKVYQLNGLGVHESIPLQNDSPTTRQFVRLSNPNDAPWYEGYTENPTGVKPAGPIHEPRTEQMNYRS